MFIVYKNAYEINKDTKVNRQYDIKYIKNGLEGNTKIFIAMSLEGQTMGYTFYYIFIFQK